MDRPRALLTVALPTYNGEAHLAETLASILAQDDVEFDLIVVDDQSADQSVALVRRLAGDRARIEVNPSRLGLAANWNLCAARCRTPFLSIIHQDDVWLPSHLAAHLEALLSDPEIGLVASGSIVIDEQGQEIGGNVIQRGGLGDQDRVFEAGGLTELMAVENPLRCSAVSMRVQAHRQAGGFDPALGYVVDWDFWLRVASTWRVAWLARASVAIRWHRGSETHRLRQGRRDLDEARDLIERVVGEQLSSHPRIRAIRRHGRLRLASAYLNRCYDSLKNGLRDLARDCLKEALRTDPRILWSILGDPRLAGRLARLAIPAAGAGPWGGPRELSGVQPDRAGKGRSAPPTGPGKDAPPPLTGSP